MLGKSVSLCALPIILPNGTSISGLFQSTSQGEWVPLPGNIQSGWEMS